MSTAGEIQGTMPRRILIVLPPNLALPPCRADFHGMLEKSLLLIILSGNHALHSAKQLMRPSCEESEQLATNQQGACTRSCCCLVLGPRNLYPFPGTRIDQGLRQKGSHGF